MHIKVETEMTVFEASISILTVWMELSANASEHYSSVFRFLFFSVNQSDMCTMSWRGALLQSKKISSS